MACMECPVCGWMGNRDPCPECGHRCLWDEEYTYRDSFVDDPEVEGENPDE